MFGCGMYRVEWYNNAGEVVKSEEKYLTWQLYNSEYFAMERAFLRGMDVASMRIIPIDD